MDNVNYVYDLARELAVKAQKKLSEEEGVSVNLHYLQSYFDEAIGNAIEREKSEEEE